VIAAHVTGEVFYLNLAAKRLLGCTLNGARGRPLHELVHVLDGATRVPVRAPLNHFLARSAPALRGEYDLLVRPNGREAPIEHHTSPIRGQRGETLGFLLVLRDTTRTRDLVRRLTVRATHDGLTRLVNRAEFERRLLRLLAGIHEGDSHALLYMDLDDFKDVNDTHGHAGGDGVLRQAARLFRSLVRDRDTLARLGGDEFGLLLEHCPGHEAPAIADKLASALEDHDFRWHGSNLRLSMSVGITPITDRRRGLREILSDADRACYATKRAARTGSPGATPRTPRGRAITN
jgi:diguanylate cyclase (GGDEF)-like protein/PAS domain S-box-containing protein